MKKAFTILEVVVVTALVSIFVMAVLGLLSVGLRTWGFGFDRAQIRHLGSAAMQRMARELSQTNSITDAQDGTITFLADLDDNGTDETITYSVSGTNLRRTEGSIVTILASNVQTFGLSYRDLNNDLLNSPGGTSTQTKRDQIRVITISLTADKDNETITLSESVFARNQ